MGLTNWERIQFIWRTFMLLSLGSSDGLPKLYSKFHIFWHIMLTWFIWLIPYIYIYISLGNQYILLTVSSIFQAKKLEANIEITKKEMEEPTEVETELKQRLGQMTDHLIQKQAQVCLQTSWIIQSMISCTYFCLMNGGHMIHLVFSLMPYIEKAKAYHNSL